MLEYKGYIGEAEIDPDAGIIHGRLVGIRPVITFECESAGGLRKAFEDAVDEYLDWCREEGEEPETPFSGRLVVRVTPEVHQDLATAAKAANQSLNAFAASALARAARKRRARGDASKSPRISSANQGSS